MLRLVVFLAFTGSAFAGSVPLNERVLIVYNAYSKDSRQVAEHYAELRRIPASNKCALDAVQFKAGSEAPAVYVAWDEYEDIMARPIRKCLEHAGKDKILYIVLTFGTPFRFRGNPTGSGDAIDSYLADVWQEARSLEPNPYYAALSAKREVYPAFESLAEYRSRPGARTVYSVWRLDAPSPTHAMRLVDKAMTAEKTGLKGIACFDRRRGGPDDMEGVPDSGYGAADWELFRAAQFAREAGFRVLEDIHEAEFGTAPAPLRCDDAALYSGWYSLNHYNDAFSWKYGAIGFHLDSASAADPRSGTNWSANALNKGITVTSGAVGEPMLAGLPHPAGVFRNLFEGANVGDALFRNTAELRWQILNIGDPLYTPFPGGSRPFLQKERKQR